MGKVVYRLHSDLNLVEMRHTGPAENSEVVSHIEEILSRGLVVE